MTWRMRHNATRAQRGEAPLSPEQQVCQGLIEYVPFPQALVGKYQCYTQADLTSFVCPAATSSLPM